jgi:peptide/nickel transport system ATP-binding protein
MEPFLSVRVSADYPAKPGVLREVAFEVAEGEIAGLAGESGSGKSTVALAILGLLGYKGGVARLDWCCKARFSRSTRR